MQEVWSIKLWIGLLELIYWHKHLWDCLGELIETTYELRHVYM